MDTEEILRHFQDQIQGMGIQGIQGIMQQQLADAYGDDDDEDDEEYTDDDEYDYDEEDDDVDPMTFANQLGSEPRTSDYYTGSSSSSTRTVSNADFDSNVFEDEGSMPPAFMAAQAAAMMQAGHPMMQTGHPMMPPMGHPMMHPMMQLQQLQMKVI